MLPQAVSVLPQHSRLWVHTVTSASLTCIIVSGSLTKWIKLCVGYLNWSLQSRAEASGISSIRGSFTPLWSLSRATYNNQTEKKGKVGTSERELLTRAYFENYGRKKLSTIFLSNLRSLNVIDINTDVTDWSLYDRIPYYIPHSDTAHPRIDRQELSPKITPYSQKEPYALCMHSWY